MLDFTGVSSIDAAGIGELVRFYNLTAAANGMLRIVHVRSRVRELLHRVALLELLEADGVAAIRPGLVSRSGYAFK